MPLGAHFENDPGPPTRAGKVYRFSLRNGSIRPGLSSTLTVRKRTSLSPRYSADNSWKWGSSFWQGPHHVAQKLRTTALPRRSLADHFFPDTSVSWNSGSGRLTERVTSSEEAAATRSASLCQAAKSFSGRP